MGCGIGTSLDRPRSTSRHQNLRSVRSVRGTSHSDTLLDPATSELVPRAREVLDRLDGDPRFKLEL